MKIEVKSPMRVDLAGGTLDLWPLHCFTGGSVTTNMSISLYTKVELIPREDDQLNIELIDLGYKKRFSSLDELLNSADKELSLVKGHLKYWRPVKGFHLCCSSDSPVGGGLGGSSSLSVSLIKAFAQWSETTLSVTEQVTLASNIEANVLHVPTGTQDYFPAIRGGLHLIEYGLAGPREILLDFAQSYFQERMFLVYTGRPHQSGLNNWEVYQAAVDKDPKTLTALLELNEVALEVAQVCRDGKWELLGDLFRKEFNARVKLCPAFNAPEIDQLKDLVMEAGADAIKICGAGGGGCVMIWSKANNKEELMELCRNNKFRVIDVQPVLQ